MTESMNISISELEKAEQQKERLVSYIKKVLTYWLIAYTVIAGISVALLFIHITNLWVFRAFFGMFTYILSGSVMLYFSGRDIEKYPRILLEPEEYLSYLKKFYSYIGTFFAISILIYVALAADIDMLVFMIIIELSLPSVYLTMSHGLRNVQR